MKRIRPCSLSRIITVLVFVLSIVPTLSIAQPRLERISKAERSDGLGYVLRYHFTHSVDSFTVIQPAPDLIQMELFAQNIDTSGIQLPDQGGKIQEVRLYKLENSFGVDIYLDSDIYVKSKAYPNWYLEINPEDALIEDAIPVPQPVNPDGNYDLIRDKLKFDTIVIDAGHGGHDPGNVGYRNAKEKDVVLAISLKLGAYIEEYLPDVKVIYTRDDDTFVDLEDRGHIANRVEGDLFVSIHADSWKSSSVRGTTVFFLGLHRSETSFEVMKRENAVFNAEGLYKELTEDDLLIYELAHSGYISTSERIATLVDKQFTERAGRKTRGVKQAGFVVLYQASMPAMLIETGFLTNPSEQRFLSSDYGQSIIASAIFRAIRDYKEEYEKTEAFASPNK